MAFWICLTFLATSNPGNSPPIPDQLQRELPAMLILAGVPGITVIYIEGSKPIWEFATGLKNTETREEMTVDAIFEAASLSKPVFAYLCMRLVDQGLLDLDQSLATILPNERMSHDPRYEAITTRMILSHRTGLPNWGGDKLELGFDPGTSFKYSGEGYVYLSQVIEKLTGKELADLFTEEVFKPLGMQHSAFTWQAKYDRLATFGHGPSGRVQSKREKRKKVNTAASLYTNTGDYARFTIAIMNGDGLKTTTHRDMLQSQGEAKFNGLEPKTNIAIEWGLGWGLLPSKVAPIYWHWGDNGNFKSLVIWNAKTQNGLIYFTNSSEGHALLYAIIEKFDKDAATTTQVLNYERFDAPGRKERRAGEQLIEKRKYDQAAYIFQIGMKANPKNQTLATMHRWASDLARVKNTPINLPTSHLKQLAGSYGPRRLTAGIDQLFYQRQGRERFPLIALGKNLFALDGIFPFRIQVVVDASGNPQKIIGHYLNGHQDESPRDSEKDSP